MARILVIDDDPVISNLMTHFLTKAEHKVAPTIFGSKGLDLFHDLRPNLIITDILMPDRGGLDIIISLRLANSTVPIVTISGSRRYLDYVRQLTTSAALRKPIDYRLLVETVAKFLRG